MIATCAAVLKNNNIWYISDLKVYPKWRKQNIPLKMLDKSFFIGLLITKKAYSIEMIGSDNKDQSRILKPLTNYKMTNLSTKNLSIYNLSYIQVKILIKYIQSYYHNDVVFLQLKNIKDLILTSTGKPIKFLHIVTKNSLKTDDIYR